MPIEHLPEAWRPTARRFRDWLATDKGLLLITFIGMLIRTSTYLWQDPWLAQHVLEIRSPVLSPLLWGMATCLVGVSVFSRSTVAETVALVAAVIVLMIWGVLFVWSSPALFTARGILYVWVAALTAYTVWRGHAGTIRVREVGDGVPKLAGRK